TDLEPIELALILLPRSPEDVIVGDRPQRPHQEQEGAEQPQRPVRALLVVSRQRLPRHLLKLRSDTARAGDGAGARARMAVPDRGSSRRPSQNSAAPLTARYSSFHMSSWKMPSQRPTPTLPNPTACSALAKKNTDHAHGAQMLMLKYGVFSTMMY